MYFTKRRSRRYKKKTYRRGRYGKKLASTIKRVITKQSEKKYIANVNTASVGTAGFVYDLTTASQGISDSARIGDQSTIRSINVRYQVNNSTGTGSDSFNVIRVMIVQWYPDTVPTLSDVMLLTSSGYLNVHSPYNHDKRFMFKVLHDRTLTVSANGYNIDYTKISGNVMITNGFRRKLQVQGGSTVGNNKIYVVSVADSSVSPDPTLGFVSKINFSDN